MDLEARIDRLESIKAIKKPKHMYMNSCDLGYPPEELGEKGNTAAEKQGPRTGE